jgi:hypothetical protein
MFFSIESGNFGIPPGSSRLLTAGIQLMRKIVAFIFLLLVSVAFSYETIVVLSGAAEKSVVCEESGSESGEQESKAKDSDDDDFFGQRHLHRISCATRDHKASYFDINHIFSSDKYCAEVYSPPEFYTLMS